MQGIRAGLRLEERRQFRDNDWHVDRHEKDDILRFRKMQPITEDEVLRLHQILERKQF